MAIPDVGAQDPELPNSPILEELTDPDDTLRQAIEDEGFCLFNGESFGNGAVVKSGTTLLRCDRGIWVPAGPADPDNP